MHTYSDADDTGDIDQLPIRYARPPTRRLRTWRHATMTCGGLCVAAIVALAVHDTMAHDPAANLTAMYLRLSAVTALILAVLVGTGCALAYGQAAERRRVGEQVAELHDDLQRDLDRIRALVAAALAQSGGRVDPASEEALRRIHLRLLHDDER